MSKIFKQSELEYLESSYPHKNFNLLTASPRLFQEVESKHLIFDMRMLPAGQFSFPYHFHHNAEEVFVILSGAATLRTPEGLQKVEAGDILFFEIGESGSHQLYNHTTESCIYLDFRTNVGFDVSEYPDSKKVNIIQAKDIFKKGEKAEYHEGEDAIEHVWKGLYE